MTCCETIALLAVAAGKRDITGHAAAAGAGSRARAAPGKSTLNRLERTPADATAAARYKKIVYDPAAIERFFVEAFLAAHPTPPAEIVLDLDATDDPLHGQQEGRFFHGYYRSYCYLPLYMFAGDFLLARSCGVRMEMAPRGPWRWWNGSRRRCGRGGRRCGSSSGRTRASRVTRS